MSVGEAPIAAYLDRYPSCTAAPQHRLLTRLSMLGGLADGFQVHSPMVQGKQGQAARGVPFLCCGRGGPTEAGSRGLRFREESRKSGR